MKKTFKKVAKEKKVSPMTVVQKVGWSHKALINQFHRPTKPSPCTVTRFI